MMIVKRVGSEVGRRIVSRRNFCSSPESSNDWNVKKRGLVGGFAARAIPFWIGYGLLGPYTFGDQVPLLEKKLKESWREEYGDTEDFVDVVVPSIGEMFCSFVSSNAARWWSAQKSSWSAPKS